MLKKEQKNNSANSPRDKDLGKVLLQAKKQLEHMIDMNPQGMLLVDSERRILRANKALLQLVNGSQFTDILDQPLESLFHCQDPAFLASLGSPHGGYKTCEALADLPGNPARMIRFTWVGSGPDSNLQALIVRDITEETEKARRAEKEHKRKAVESLMGALMHNINQPLTVITLRSQLMLLALRNGQLDPAEFNRSLQDIIRLSSQISDILAQAGAPTDFITQPYVAGVDILDIERSGSRKQTDTYSRVLLDSFLVALDAHSPGSTLHARRTGTFAAHLAEVMGLDKKQVEKVKRGAFFHDIGKIGIPDRILQKPSALNDEELKIMRRHPQIGYDILRSFPFLQEEADTALSHHERMDGSGYPQKLTGTDISLTARITAVADVFDALRFSRAYQPALPFPEVIQRMSIRADVLFDPAVMKAFRSCAQDLDRLFTTEETRQPAPVD